MREKNTVEIERKERWGPPSCRYNNERVCMSMVQGDLVCGNLAKARFLSCSHARKREPRDFIMRDRRGWFAAILFHAEVEGGKGARYCFSAISMCVYVYVSESD